MDNILRKGTESGSYSYGYEELYWLISGDNPIQDDEAFSYDAVGNLAPFLVFFFRVLIRDSITAVHATTFIGARDSKMLKHTTGG